MATVGEVRARSRGEIRTLVLDAARASAVDQGWRAVRMGELAGEVGVSRQALHQEFGAKAQLGSELVHREIDELVTGFATALAVSPAGRILAAMVPALFNHPATTSGLPRNNAR